MIGIAVGVDNIEAVFNVLGAICSSSICLLLPCFFYCKLILKLKQKKTIKYYLSWVMMLVMTPYALFSIVSMYVTD
jgi:amino acid permease